MIEQELAAVQQSPEDVFESGSAVGGARQNGAAVSDFIGRRKSTERQIDIDRAGF